MKNILITGGAGYIGSHVVKALKNHDVSLVIYDNLSTGHEKAVTVGKLVVGDLSDKIKVERLFSESKFDSVLHFAGSIVVPESVKKPLKYYSNNTSNTQFLLELCLKYNVNKFIFSSTAAVYGMPTSGECSEKTILSPINPYGRSKLMSEEMLSDVSQSSSLRYVALRYFNVSGADPEGEIGHSFPEATHLIKVACEAAAGKRESISIYGTDYPTPDGTCVRDFIHVSDLAMAHVKALEYLDRGGDSQVLNCGYGHGYSVRQVIDKVREITKKNIVTIDSPRRDGDPASVTAKVDRIHNVIDWSPKYDNLDFIIKTSYNWEINRHY